MNEYLVEMIDITKRFGDVQAVKNGQFNLRKGEIHSLIGENGAGKSTMMKLLFGMYPVTSGQIIYKGYEYSNLTTNEAIELGIGMVHQEFMLVDELTVLENIILGSEPTKGGAIDFKKARKDAEYYIDTYKLDVDLDKKVAELSVGEAQRVEIIKVLSKDAEVIIFDEPTAVLTPQESESLFEIIQGLRENGKSIVFISHKMDEVLNISDRITVMRQGSFIDTIDVEDASYSILSKMMVGREVFLNNKRLKNENISDDMALEIQNIWVPGDKELSKIKGLSLEVMKGEIVGVAGIDGNGQLELEEAISGLRSVEKGKVLINGEDITNKPPKEIRKAGFNYIPSDRNTRGLNRDLSIEDNLMMTELGGGVYERNGFLDREKIFNNAEDLITKFDIRPPNPKELTSSQSGGNAQKVVVGREVSKATHLLVAAQPTRGVDIGAIESIRESLQKASQAGVGILLISADLDEILSMSDRIVVLYEGQIVAEFNSDEVSDEDLGIYMMGGKKVV